MDTIFLIIGFVLLLIAFGLIGYIYYKDKSILNINAAGDLYDNFIGGDMVSENLPLSSIIAFTGDTVPEPYFLECDGRSISKTSYPDLFSSIGYRYTPKSSMCTPAGTCDMFNIPDLRGVFVRGLDKGRGLDPNSSRLLGSYQKDFIGNHRHYQATNDLYPNFDNTNNNGSNSPNRYLMYNVGDNSSKGIYTYNLVPASFYANNATNSTNCCNAEANMGLTSYPLVGDIISGSADPDRIETLKGVKVNDPKRYNPITLSSNDTIPSSPISGTDAVDTRPKNVALIYIIKCKYR